MSVHQRAAGGEADETKEIGSGRYSRLWEIGSGRSALAGRLWGPVSEEIGSSR